MKVLLVGQGVAGTILHFELFRRGISADVIDSVSPGQSSVAAAGIINPITGRKFVKTWLIDDLLPVFLDTYQRLSELLAVPLLHELKFYRFLKDDIQLQHWKERLNDAEYKNFIDSNIISCEPADTYRYKVRVNHAYQLNMHTLLSTYRTFLQHKGLLNESLFQFSSLHLSVSSTEYLGKEYDLIIFCEGYRINENPYFSYLPVIPNLGKAILTKQINLPEKTALKKKNFLCQWNDDTHWYGASMHVWDGDIETIQTFPMELVEDFVSDFGSKVSVLKFLSGIRPTVKDRRPILGAHPDFSSLICFNGLGTKGVSLAPKMAVWLCDYLINDKQIPREVDIRRWDKLSVTTKI